LPIFGNIISCSSVAVLIPTLAFVVVAAVADPVPNDASIAVVGALDGVDMLVGVLITDGVGVGVTGTMAVVDTVIVGVDVEEEVGAEMEEAVLILLVVDGTDDDGGQGVVVVAEVEVVAETLLDDEIGVNEDNTDDIDTLDDECEGVISIDDVRRLACSTACFCCCKVSKRLICGLASAA
jgi:hypothetical protein